MSVRDLFHFCKLLEPFCWALITTKSIKIFELATQTMVTWFINEL